MAPYLETLRILDGVGMKFCFFLTNAIVLTEKQWEIDKEARTVVNW